MASAVVGPPITEKSPTGVQHIGTTKTSCCCGIFSLRVGARLVAILTVLEGCCQIWIMLDDRFTGSPVFRWGPPSVEMHLQLTNAVVGLAGIAYGTMGWLTTVSNVKSGQYLKATHVYRFRRFQGATLMWTLAWFLIVGLPSFVNFVNVPIVQRWPLSIAPGMPHTQVIDPEYPNGKPHVCLDVNDMKLRWAQLLNHRQKNPVLRGVLKKVYRAIFRKVLPCKLVVRIFWAWMAIDFLIRCYFYYVIDFLYRVLLRGGNGDYVYGDLSDLYKPISDRATTKQLIRSKIEEAFRSMDKNKDGRLTLDELLASVEESSENALLH